MSGHFVSGQGISKSLKSQEFFVKVVVNYFISCLHTCTDKGSLPLLIASGQNNHPAQSVKIAFQSGKSPEFFFMLPTGK